MTLSRFLCSCGLIAALPAFPAWAQQTEGARDSFAVQEARTKSIQASMGRRFYPEDYFKLDDLPEYAPEQKVSGVIRVWGADFLGRGGLAQAWEAGFRRHHPDAQLEFNLKGPALAVDGLFTGVSDIGPGRRATWETLLAFQRIFGYDPLVVHGATGWGPGENPPFSIWSTTAIR